MPEFPTTPLAQKVVALHRDGEEREAERKAEQAGVPYVDIRKIPVSIEAIALIPEQKAKEASAVAIEVKANQVAIATENTETPALKQIVQTLKDKKYDAKIFLASHSGIAEAWRMYQFVTTKLEDITGKVAIEQRELQGFLETLTTVEAVQKALEAFSFEKGSTTSLFELILGGAIANKASDIHFEAEEKGAKIRFRLDGVLHDVYAGMPARAYASLMSRTKLLSELKMNVYEEPQDGRFTITLPNKEIEMRVSIIPSEFGETAVMRILDPDAINTKLEEMGMRKDTLALARMALKAPNGLILNTGPTGSGKTTTLYAFLKEIYSSEVKIITIEDPIEYKIPGIEQTQTHPETGYTFASGLRAIMRQDPDVILVGEIRDRETADIAMEASLTGHLVLSTLHANDAAATIPRLSDLGVKAETMGPALTLVIAQRLVRKLCPSCKEQIALTKEEQEHAEAFLLHLPPAIDKAPYQTKYRYAPKGCSLCNGTGYKGRLGIFELMTAGAALEELIMKHATDTEIRAFAKAQGMITLQEDGILKVLAGETDWDEVEKVTGPIVWGK